MKLLVTGGCGFIGSNFIQYILEKQEEIKIINIDNLTYGSNLKNLTGIDNHRYRFLYGDITNRDLMESTIKDVDGILNFAAETHVDRSIADPHPFFKSNTYGAITILEAIRTINPTLRFIQVGTDEVYGSTPTGSFTEQDPLNPSSPYSASKAAADLITASYHKTYDLDVIITRCTNNFGPFQFPEKLIPKTMIRAQKNLKIPVYGSGKNIRDWIFVLDHCEALTTIMDCGKPGEIYNIASGNEYDNLTVIQQILALMKKKEDLIQFAEDRPGHDFRYSLDNTKITHQLKWQPTHNFDQALQRTVKWYLENEKWWTPLANHQILHPTPWKLTWKTHNNITSNI